MKNLLILAAIHVACTIANYTECGYMDNNGTIYDLTDLTLDGSNELYYQLPAGADATQTPVVYMNFCEDVHAAPAGCDMLPTKVCVEGEDTANCQDIRTRTAGGAVTHAYVKFPDGTCRATAGSSAEDFINQSKLIDFTTELYDGADTLVMTYNYGDYCNITGSAANRQLKVYMVCDDNITDIAPNTRILEAASHADGGCLTQIMIASTYGCPVYVAENITATTTEEPSTNTTEEEVFTTTDMETSETEDLNMTEVTDETSTTASPFSVYGKWGKYDMDDNEVFGISIGVNTDCTQVTFTMYSPANNTWFGFGIGGDYEHESSEELEASSGESNMNAASDSEADVMNGYAIISTGIGMGEVFESTLESGMIPVNQANAGGSNDLTCSGKEENGVRYVTCTRDYETNDAAHDDFNEFIAGVNDIIYAYGPISSTGVLLQHHDNQYGYGEAHESFIYMQAEDALCGYAEEYAKQEASGGMTETDDTWMIVGIIFIILFAIACGAVIYLVWKMKNDEPQKGGRGGGYQPTSAQDED